MNSKLFDGAWVVVMRNGVQLPKKINGFCTENETKLYLLSGDTEYTREQSIERISLSDKILVGNGYERTLFDEGDVCYYTSPNKRIIVYPNLHGNSNHLWDVHIDNCDMDTLARLELTFVDQLQFMLPVCEMEDDFVVKQEWIMVEDNMTYYEKQTTNGSR